MPLSGATPRSAELPESGNCGNGPNWPDFPEYPGGGRATKKWIAAGDRSPPPRTFSRKMCEKPNETGVQNGVKTSELGPKTRNRENEPKHRGFRGRAHVKTGVLWATGKG